MPELSDSVNRKFIETFNISDLQIETEDGWVDITHLNVTVPYTVWSLKTTTCSIECADNHIIFDEFHNQIFVKDLHVGQKIIGQYGFEEVISVEVERQPESMFDLSVTGNHTYYAEGLLHHNTTVSAAYFVWFILFSDNKSVAIFANKQKTADEIMSRVRRAYENLPIWLQQGVKTWNKRTIELENGSTVYGQATSSSGNRGGSVNILYLDEFAFVENNQAEEFFTSVYPTITAGKDSKVFMTSTPHGYNHFHKFWIEANKTLNGEPGGNGFFPLRVHWYETPGRDQKWYNEQKAVLGELKAAQELDAEFIGSSKTLLTGATLARLVFDKPIKEFADQEKGLKIYAYPEKNHKYTVTVDVSRGRHLDYSAFTVFDITDYPHRIVATYRNNEIAPMLYASLVHKISRNYNEAYILVEINDIGAQVAETLWNDLEYLEIFWTKSGDMLGKKGADPYPGIRTTKKTKRIGCANLKDMIDNNQIIINDYDMIQELSTFIQKDNGGYEADEGFHDDTVATLWLYAWMASQPWFRDLTDTNIRSTLHAEHIRQMEESLLMPGFSDGNEFYDDTIVSSVDEYGWSLQ